LSILIISDDLTIQNVVEQVGITCGYLATTAGTVREAEAELSRLGYQQFALIVIDSDVLGEGALELQFEVSALLRVWPGQYPGLPVVFLGTALQKYAVLAAQPALVPFILIPFSPHDLMQTIQPLLLLENSCLRGDDGVT
jgi:CheY-like chemotaxis protein